VRIEIINTGAELLLGRVLNSHQQFLCRRLADLGWVTARQTAISDDGEVIEQAVKQAIVHAQNTGPTP